MKFRVLSMLDCSACPQVLEPLRTAAELIEVPASQKWLIDNIGGYDAFLTSLTVQTNREVLSRAKSLKVLVTPSTGTDHIDVTLAEEMGIRLISLKHDIEFLRSVTATAELAWGLLLAVVRRIPSGFEAAKTGSWARDEYRGRQLSGKTLGVLGYGRLGEMVAEYGKAFRMKVIACDIRDVEPAKGVGMVTRDRLLSESDVLSIHIHLTEENRRLIGPESFAKMKPGAVLINTSRGAIIDEEALLEALLTVRIAGAGLDVIEGEWRDDLDQHPLIRYARENENLVITPHVGGVTYESQEMAYGRIVGKLVDYIASDC